MWPDGQRLRVEGPFQALSLRFWSGLPRIDEGRVHGDAAGRICGLDVGGSDDSQLYFDSAALVRLSPPQIQLKAVSLFFERVASYGDHEYTGKFSAVSAGRTSLGVMTPVQFLTVQLLSVLSLQVHVMARESRAQASLYP